MSAFLKPSINRELITSMMATSVIVLVLASSALLTFHIYSFKQQMTKDMLIKAEIVGTNSTAAMLFNDRDSAEKTLEGLRAEPSIVEAYIYGDDGKVFAGYHEGHDVSPPSFEKLKRDGYRFEGNFLGVWKEIVLDGGIVGKVYIKSELNELYGQFKKYLLVVSVILLISAMISFVLSSKFQKSISKPILDIAKNMKAISQEKDYSIRMEESREDELGLLIRGFNEMLTQIQVRDEALEHHREQLENEVATRTMELSKTNQDLELLIVELKEAKRNAEHANQAKSDFLANMSHELRTPLNHIIGFTELVVDKTFGELTDPQEEYLNDVLNSSRHLLSLINDVLDLSKVEAGKLELDRKPVSLEHLMRNSLIMVKEKALKHGLKMSCRIGKLPDFIEADERKLKQIIYNLLSNAVKFTPDGGNITLSAELANGNGGNGNKKGRDTLHPWVLISVSDSGIGLKQKDLDRIFAPFEQVESSRSRKFQGTGLGLSLVRNLVDLHGGKIWAESAGEGEGAVFTLKIPTSGQEVTQC